MGIENLLAQGVELRRPGMERNALMQAQEFRDRQQRNALMQMQMQDVSQQRQMAMQQAMEKAAAAKQLQGRRGSYLDSVSPAMGPARPVDAAQALLAGLDEKEIAALRGPKPAALMNIAPGGNAFDPETRQPVFTAPFKPEPPRLPPLGQMQEYRDNLPPNDPRRREAQAVIDNQTRPPKYAGGGAVGGPAAAAPKPLKPLPPGALKMQQESLDRIGISASINADLGSMLQQIDGGQLDFGPVSNIINKGRNLVGASTEQSRNLSTFKSTLERLRNESLRLNTGVQTDGDAQRAWNELFENITDTKLVRQRLAEIQKINERGAELQRLRVDSVRAEYGHEPLDASSYSKQPAAVGGAYSDAEKERRYQEWKAKQK